MTLFTRVMFLVPIMSTHALTCNEVKTFYSDATCCNAPNPDESLSNTCTPVSAFGPNSVAHVQSVIDAYVATDGVENYQIVFGNAFTGEEHHVVSGVQHDGSALTTDNYARWASMSKLVGGLTVAKALEEGIIGLDDEIKTYIPAFAKENLQVVNDAADGVVACDTDITVRHLLTMRAGFSLGLWTDLFAGALNSSLPKEVYLKANYTAQYEKLDTFIALYTSGNPTFTNDDFIANLAATPLVAQPGVSVLYGTEFNVVGAVISASLSAKGLFNGNSIEYAQAKILDPLGMSKTWFNMGQSSAPADAAAKLVDVTMLRSDAHGVVDPNVAAYVDVQKWLKDVPGDSYNTGLEASFLLPKDASQQYPGDFTGSAAGPLTDFSKLLKLVVNKGVLNNQRIVGAQALEFLLQTSSPDATSLQLGSGPFHTYPGADGPHRWSYIGGWRYDENGADTPYPFTGGSLGWDGFFRTTWSLDLNTGYYQVGGTQSPATARAANYIAQDVTLRAITNA